MARHRIHPGSHNSVLWSRQKFWKNVTYEPPWFIIKERDKKLFKSWWTTVADGRKRINLLPPANEVWSKVMFSHVSVILLTGAVYLQEGSTNGGSASKTGSESSWGGVCLQRVGLLAGLGRPSWNHKSGQYASSWNAFFLLFTVFTLLTRHRPYVWRQWNCILICQLVSKHSHVYCLPTEWRR